MTAAPVAPARTFDVCGELPTGTTVLEAAGWPSFASAEPTLSPENP